MHHFDALNVFVLCSAKCDRFTQRKRRLKRRTGFKAVKLRQLLKMACIILCQPGPDCQGREIGELQAEVLTAGQSGWNPQSGAVLLQSAPRGR
ncbi:hypothetical protein NDU88_007181 [Pleurodeles waltl]|uniref:Uncharacterized protein n=1 Tax=Pleurodeles waltl TaxID=8319 RepID=A0AAV7WCR0_PLEWA|nr:hypothetical protein NDU88_007181 [Pleurodeles waltl]